jgi:iron complex outermembrane receptor protein
MTNSHGVLRGLLLCGGALAALAGGGSAHAQVSTAPSQGTALEEVVVTAQRRAERLEDVPMAITAITAQGAEDRGVKNLQDVTQVTSGVQINFAGSFTSVSVRGISAPSGGFGTEGNVATYIDGYYEPDNAGLNSDFNNLSSIQILKGPQGTLYGRNSAGGAILMTTLKPSATLTGKIEGTYGTYNDVSLGGYVSGPINDKVRYSLSAYGRKTPGYYDLLDAKGVKIGDDAAQIYDVTVRSKLEADVTDNLTATLGYNFVQYRDDRANMFTAEQYRPASLPPKVGRLYDPRTFATNRDTNQLFIMDEGTLTLVYKTPIGTLSSYTGGAYRRVTGNFDFDGSWLDLNWSVSKYHESTFQQGLDFNFDKIKNLELIVGGTLWYDRVKSDILTEANNKITARTVLSNPTQAWAIFADGTYHLTDKLVLNLGARYTKEQRQVLSSTTLFPSATFSGVPVDVNTSYSNFSPRGSIRYEIDNNTNVYASISRGFRAGTVAAIPTPTGPVAVPVQPEIVTAYELGFKTAHSSFQFDTAAFYYDYSNLQISALIPNPVTGQPTSITLNATDAKIYGVEAQGTWKPTDHLELNAGVTLLHAHYGDFKNATGVGLNVATMTNVSGQSQDVSGDQMIRAPNSSATVGASYDFQNVFGGSLLATGNVKYTASYLPNNFSHYGPLAGAAVANQQRYRQGGYTLVNASLVWTDPTDHYTLGVWGNNLFDKSYRLSRNGSAFGDYGIWAWPRQVGIRAGYKF